MKKAALAFIDACVCLARKVWRPITCLGIACAVGVKGVYIPLVKGEVADMTALAALVASLTPFVAARTWEKIKGEGE